MSFDNATELREHLRAGAYENLIDICREVVRIFADCCAEDGPMLLKMFLQDIALPELTEKGLTKEFLWIDAEQMADFQEFLTLENRVVSNLTKDRVSTDAFYRSLWEKINDPTLISDERGKTAFLFFLRIDNRIPYFELDEGYLMDDQRYKELVNKIQPAITKGLFIFNTDLKYKTQRASLLMDVAKGLSDEEERIVFWAVLLGRIRTIQRLQKQAVQIEQKEKNIPPPPQKEAEQES